MTRDEFRDFVANLNGEDIDAFQIEAKETVTGLRVHDPQLAGMIETLGNAMVAIMNYARLRNEKGVQ